MPVQPEVLGFTNRWYPFAADEDHLLAQFAQRFGDAAQVGQVGVIAAHGLPPFQQTPASIQFP